MKHILDNLDQFFETQKEQEQKLLFFLPVLLFGFLSYYFIYSITDENLINAINSNKSLNQKISKIKSDNIKLRRKNAKLNKTLKVANKTLKELNTQKVELDTLLKKLQFLKFDLIKWADFYNTIPNLVKKHNLIIVQLDNLMLDKNKDKLVQKKMEITISTIGDFINFIKFINEFESKKELIKVKALNIKSNKMFITLDIYGAEL